MSSNKHCEETWILLSEWLDSYVSFAPKTGDSYWVFLSKQSQIKNKMIFVRSIILLPVDDHNCELQFINTKAYMDKHTVNTLGWIFTSALNEEWTCRKDQNNLPCLFSRSSKTHLVAHTHTSYFLPAAAHCSHEHGNHREGSIMPPFPTLAFSS